jgi:hypothetical protein
MIALVARREHNEIHILKTRFHDGLAIENVITSNHDPTLASKNSCVLLVVE